MKASIFLRKRRFSARSVPHSVSKQSSQSDVHHLATLTLARRTGRCSSARRTQQTELALLVVAVIPHFAKTGRCSSARRKQPTELALLVLAVIPHFGKKKNMNIRMRKHMQMHVRKPMTRITIKIYASINTHRRNYDKHTVD